MTKSALSRRFERRAWRDRGRLADKPDGIGAFTSETSALYVKVDLAHSRKGSFVKLGSVEKDFGGKFGACRNSQKGGLHSGIIGNKIAQIEAL